ncbi:hypothetical protein CB1_001428044 [Camelus ferus]|nr:hypothetical protein CB1_001428044 [Camelus ferus]
MRKLKGAETVFWPSSGGTHRSLRPLTEGGSPVPGRRLGVGALCGPQQQQSGAEEHTSGGRARVEAEGLQLLSLRGTVPGTRQTQSYTDGGGGAFSEYSLTLTAAALSAPLHY